MLRERPSLGSLIAANREDTSSRVNNACPFIDLETKTTAGKECKDSHKELLILL